MVYCALHGRQAYDYGYYAQPNPKVFPRRAGGHTPFVGVYKCGCWEYIESPGLRWANAPPRSTDVPKEVF